MRDVRDKIKDISTNKNITREIRYEKDKINWKLNAQNQQHKPALSESLNLKVNIQMHVMH